MNVTFMCDSVIQCEDLKSVVQLHTLVSCYYKS